MSQRNRKELIIFLSAVLLSIGLYWLKNFDENVFRSKRKRRLIKKTTSGDSIFIEQLISYWKLAPIYWLFSGQAVHVTIRLFQMEWKYQFWLFGYLFHRIPNKADKGQNSILAQMSFWFETWTSLKAKGRIVSLLKTELDTTLLGFVVTICNFSERSF